MFGNLPNIAYVKEKTNPTVDSNSSMFEIPFYKDVDYFAVMDNNINFIKSVETGVRTSDDYSKYKDYIMNDVGLSACQVLSNITKDDAKLEMHHGPILNLFEVVSIVLDSLLYAGKSVTTFDVVELVLEEHFLNNVQVMMAAITIHELIHNNDVFVNYKHGFGNLPRFLEKYEKGLQTRHKNHINKYIQRSIKEDSSDNGVLELTGFVHRWRSDLDF